MSKARTLANLMSDNAELADGQISVAEVVGAAPLASPDFTGTLSLAGTDLTPDFAELNHVNGVTSAIQTQINTKSPSASPTFTGTATVDILNVDEASILAIAKDISDTAVDVFVYDTSKDSDGGAWRKRTQHTSWYNEAASATRSSRKEFPAVAVIVAESAKVTIYDGDDPDMPMWMVFNASGGNGASMLGRTNEATTCVAMLNGQLEVGRSTFGLHEVFFIEDRGFFREAGNVNAYVKAIVDRNGTNAWGPNLSPVGDLVNDVVNDVAMTVLPNAPINYATGLPVPTIAVGTNGGVSVIKDNGTVVDITQSTSYKTILEIAFTYDNKILYTMDNSSSRSVRVDSIPSADFVVTTNQLQQGSGEEMYNGADFGHSTGDLAINLPSGSVTKVVGANLNERIVATPQGITNIALSNQDSPSTGMTNFITSDYNTGWMNGDIKLATLSDTDTANVTGAELVDFSAASDWAVSSAAEGSVAFGSGVLTITNARTNNPPVFVSQAITTVVGKQYVAVAIAASGSSVASFALIVNNSASTSSPLVNSSTGSWNTENTNVQATFTATATTTHILLRVNANSVGTCKVKSCSVRIAEEDRSVNGNGLQVFGTVPKNLVATGADLVSYGGFTTNNYLQQPYNSDLDMFKSATGTFVISGWFKRNGATSSHDVMFSIGEPGTAGKSRAISIPSTSKLGFYGWQANYDSFTNHVTVDGVWTQFCFIYTYQKHHWYVNGQFDSVHAKPLVTYTSNSPLKLGDIIVRTGSASRAFLGSMALWRVSATVPSAEQIAKMYNDEKHLFQAGAKATLHGTSDAVTALAHDDTTDLLHVGTSAGRSVFQGLRRVENTTDAVGATISASNGLVAED